jgi:hypothetical protein
MEGRFLAKSKRLQLAGAIVYVPRNYLYGMRSPRTLWTNETAWYRQNVITGVVMVLTGAIWLAVLAVR